MFTFTHQISIFLHPSIDYGCRSAARLSSNQMSSDVEEDPKCH